MASFTHTVPVAVSSSLLWTLIGDPWRTAKLFPYVTVEDIAPEGPGNWVYWRHLTIPSVASLRWQEQATIIGDNQLRFKAVGGDLEIFDGTWAVDPDGDDSTLTLSIEYVIPKGVGPNLPAPMVNYVMGEMFKTICHRMKETAEEELG